jgi:TRAP-type transport system periplasmic protein
MDKLTPEQRKIMSDSAKLAQAEQRKASAENSKQLVTALQAKGMAVNTISDPAAFRKSVAPVYEKFRPSIGAELLNMALEQVK